MPPKKHGVTWQAPPHTLSKIEIQRKYLNAWFPIMGTAFRSKPLLYIEGFAGSGQYEGGEAGSATTAVNSALAALEGSATRWTAGNIHLEFIEQDGERASALAQNLAACQHHPKLKRSVRCGAFDRELLNIRSEHPSSFTDGFPLFTFLDPFGVKGIPFSTVQSLLGGNHSELLLFLNAQSVARNWKARNSELLNALFGDDNWQSMNADSMSHIQLCRLAAFIYRERLKNIGVKYSIPFAMHGQRQKLNYYLLFASRHPTGFDKMAEVMRTISTDGQFRFCDATHRNLPLDFGPNEAADKLLQIFKDRNDVSIDQINETFRVEVLFPTVTSVLSYLQAQGRITVNWRDPAKPGRKGSFKKERVKSIAFK